MRKAFTFFIALLPIGILQAQNVGIGTTSPAASAQLEVNSASKGFLPPRMSASQRDAITTPVAGLMIWCSNCGSSGEAQVFNGTAWTNLVGGAASAATTVIICSQVWMLKNLDVVTYRNGDTIPQVTDGTTWSSLTTGAWCWFSNDAGIGSVYGKLYNWYAVNDPRGLAPVGWHIPSAAEFSTLATCLGGSATAGGGMKETGTAHWFSPNVGATNSSGFTALPAGGRFPPFGSSLQKGSNGVFWTSTEGSGEGLTRSLNYNDSNLLTVFYPKVHGFPVRCVKD